MKLWAGRFGKELDAAAMAFNSSIAFDKRLYEQDIRGSLAHSHMLAAAGIISQGDKELIHAGLKTILKDLQTGRLEFDDESEDIHSFVEQELVKRVGDAGKRLHTGRSRNDQIAVDMRLYLRDEIKDLVRKLKDLLKVLCDKAVRNLDSIMPGYTHLQRAQPVTFAHYLMAYAQMFLRDAGRLEDAGRRMNECPLGSGALAGTTYPIDRDMTSGLLGFDKPNENSMDGVSDRDYCVEFMSALALIMTHLSRFSEEIILFCSWEFKFLELDDAFSTGSSIMPQKKNPDMAELIRGKTGRVVGGLTGLLTMLKGLSLAYNKDMQEDKETVFGAIDTVKPCLTVFTHMLETAQVLKHNMRAAASNGFINATDCADYLSRKGLPFRDAYRITGGIVAFCIKEGLTLETLPLEKYKEFSELFAEDVYKAVDLDACVGGRTSRGGPSPGDVMRQIKFMQSKL